jgi:hypothetical protein
MFGGSWWTVGIDNASNAVATILGVKVKAIDTNGLEVPDGCEQVDNTTTLDQVFDRSILAAISGSLDGGLPHQHTVMAYTTTRPHYTLSVTIDFEDEAGYQWRRTDTSQPRLLAS